MRLKTLIVVLSIFKSSHCLFFSSLGLGSSNCQCQSSCGSPPPPIGCFCAPQQPSGCSAGPVYSQPVASSYPSYPSYQPQTPIGQPPYQPPYQMFPSYQQPPPPAPYQPPQQFQQPPIQQPVGYGSQQAYAQSQPSNEQYSRDEQQVKLQPPIQQQTEYMSQLVKAFEPTVESTTAAQQIDERIKSLPKSYYESYNQRNSNEIRDTVEEYQPKTTTTPQSSKFIPFRGGHEIKTTEIKITQVPYEEENEQEQYEENHSDIEENTSMIPIKITPSWNTPITSQYYTTTQKAQVEPSHYSNEPKRGEGVIGGSNNNNDISESGYEFNGVSSSVPPITLEYLSVAKKAEELNEEEDINPQNEISEFTKDVDKYHKSSGSTVPLPNVVTPSSNTDEFGYGAARDPRNSDNTIKVTAAEMNRKNENKNESENEIYDELTNTNNQIGKNDYENESNEVPDISKTKKKDEEKVSKCNSAKMKEMMHKKMTISPSISKQMIYSAASEMYPGRNMNVICSKHSFSYIVVTSPIFCEHRKRPLTCFAFFQP